MVLIGKVNSDLVAHLASLGAQGCRALGHRRRADQGAASATRSSGFVGEVTEVDLGPVKALMDAGYLVVIAPSATDDDRPAAQRQRRLDRRRHRAGA